MTFAQAVKGGSAEGGAGVEEAVGDVDGPDGEGEERGDPEG